MNVEFINPFLTSMCNVLVTMAKISPKALSPIIKDGVLPSSDITGFIPMSSPTAVGTLAISYSESVILQIATNMLGEKFNEINDEVADLVGELTNMVTGGAKSLLETKGHDFDMATPIVQRGKEEALSHTGNGNKVIVIPFDTEAGKFFIEVCFEMK